MQTPVLEPPNTVSTPLDAEQTTQDVLEKYQQFVNPTQVALLKIGGFDHIEDHAEGVYITDLDVTRRWCRRSKTN